MLRALFHLAVEGSGKSVMIAEIAKKTTSKGNRVLFLVHRKELKEQIAETFKWWGVDMNLVEVGMVQTIVRRLEKTIIPNLIITDENHHALANSYKKIYEYFSNARLVGFTATPIRLNGGGLGDVNDKLILGPTVTDLISWGNLAPYKYYAPAIVDTSKLRVRRGEYVARDVDEMFQNKAIWGDVIKHYRKLSDGKQAICYCSSIKQSIEMSEKFNEAGIVSKHIDGTTPKNEREDIIDKFRIGEVIILCNVDIVGEGFDVPDCNTSILLRPTKSLSLYIQQSMRCMRYKEGKTAVIIDHVGNVAEHSLPDTEHKWSLETRKKGKSEKADAPVKMCDMCFYTVPANTKICPECEYEFKLEEKELEQVEGELIEVNALGDDGFIVDTREPKDCENMSELHELARNKGYKTGWVFYQAKARGWI